LSIISLTTPKLRAVWIVYWVVLFALMHTPAPDSIHISIRFADKVVHCGAYAILATFCVTYARRRCVAATFQWFVFWAFLFAVYAAADELLQAIPIVNRTADVFDWLADMTGVAAVFAFSAMRFCHRR